MGIGEVLTLIFVVLKLVDVISWSWIWVLSPLWIPYMFIFILIIVMKILM
jgi:hypothetical protein